MKIYKIIIVFILVDFSLKSVSIVYNFRVAQITKQFQFDKDPEKHSTLILLGFDQFRKKYCTGIKQNFAGGFYSFIHDKNRTYVRLDSAFSNIREYTNGELTFTDTETDDILLTIGNNFHKTNKNLVTFSGLAGFPTHQILRLKHTDFGYGQYSYGFQLDGSHSFFQDHSNVFIYGARYLNFLSRKAFDSAGNRYKFTIGNMADLLVADKNVWGTHSLEYGYTAKFRFGAEVTPNFDQVVQKTNYIRSNFYAVYRYKFKTKHLTNKLYLDFSYGFDHIPKNFGNKYIIFVWASWSGHF